MTSAAAIVVMVVASAFAAAIAVVAAMASALAVTAASATVASAAAMRLRKVLAVETFCKLLLSSFAYRYDLTCEMEGLACHSMIEVHLHAVFRHFENYTWDNAAHTVEHWDGVAWNEEIFAYHAVHLECRLRKVDDSFRLDFAVTVNR